MPLGVALGHEVADGPHLAPAVALHCCAAVEDQKFQRPLRVAGQLLEAGEGGGGLAVVARHREREEDGARRGPRHGDVLHAGDEGASRVDALAPRQAFEPLEVGGGEDVPQSAVNCDSELYPRSWPTPMVTPDWPPRPGRVQELLLVVLLSAADLVVEDELGGLASASDRAHGRLSRYVCSGGTPPEKLAAGVALAAHRPGPPATPRSPRRWWARRRSRACRPPTAAPP